MYPRTCFNRKLGKGVGEQILSKGTALSKSLGTLYSYPIKTNNPCKPQKPTLSAREQKIQKNLGIP